MNVDITYMEIYKKKLLDGTLIRWINRSTKLQYIQEQNFDLNF